MKKYISVFILVIAFIMLPQVSFAATNKPIFFLTGPVKDLSLQGVGTVVDEAKFLEMTTADAYQITSGKKNYTINSLYATKGKYADGSFNYQINYYTALNANSGSNIFVLTGKFGEPIVSVNGAKGTPFKVYKKELSLIELPTAGETELVSTKPGQGVQYIYTTEWNDAFNDFEKQLVKISTTYEDTVGVYTYKKDGFQNYATCVKSIAKPFCFKHVGNQLVFSARAQLGNVVSFWVTEKEKNKVVACPSATKKFVMNKEGYQFCYLEGGKVGFDGDSVGLLAANNVASGMFMGAVTVKEFKGTINDYLASLASDGVVANKKSIINKVKMYGVSYEFGSGGYGEQSAIFQNPITNKFYIISYPVNGKEDSEFLQMIIEYFSFLK